MAGLQWICSRVNGKAWDAASMTAMILWYEPERGQMGPDVFLQRSLVSIWLLWGHSLWQPEKRNPYSNHITIHLISLRRILTFSRTSEDRLMCSSVSLFYWNMIKTTAETSEIIEWCIYIYTRYWHKIQWKITYPFFILSPSSTVVACRSQCF